MFDCLQAKENTNFVMKKLETAKKSLRTAENRHESHMHTIRDLERQLEEVDQKRREFDGQVCSELFEFKFVLDF